MKTISIVTLCLCTIALSHAKPPPYLGYQDSTGQYSFGYSGPTSARSEYRSPDGVTHGTYSYVDRNGLVQTAAYQAGEDLGFRVHATNLPQAPLPVQDTPEVMLAREMHLQLLDEAKKREESDRALKTGTEGRSAGAAILSEAGEDVGTPGTVDAKDVEDARAITESQARHVESTVISEAAGPEKTVQSEGSAAVPEVKSVAEPRENSASVIKSALHLEVSPVEAKDKIQITSRSEGAPTLQQPLPLATIPLAPSHPSPAAAPVIIPQPVDYTPEVIAAREAHFRAYETAAKLAAEADSNPKVLEQFLRGQTDHGPTEVSTKIESRPVDPQFANPTTITTMLKVSEGDIPIKESSVMGDGGKENQLHTAQPNENLKSADSPKPHSELTPASTSLRVPDIRLPSLNEFQQTKLKAGTFITPIEIPHVTPINGLPKLYHPFFGSSTFYVYL